MRDVFCYAGIILSLRNRGRKVSDNILRLSMREGCHLLCRHYLESEKQRQEGFLQYFEAQYL